MASKSGWKVYGPVARICIRKEKSEPEEEEEEEEEGEDDGGEVE